jgi:hypothetical protein
MREPVVRELGVCSFIPLPAVDWSPRRGILICPSTCIGTSLLSASLADECNQALRFLTGAFAIGCELLHQIPRQRNSVLLGLV